MNAPKLKLGIVGVGKIVRDQHWPAIKANEQLELVATASRAGSIDDIPAYLSIEEMVAATPELDAVALCMPPQYRFAYAQFALEHGLHTLLEKPPGATVCEVEHLKSLAINRNLSLYATWHSRHASSVGLTKQILDNREVLSIVLNWKEDVRKWHPGQTWIWEAGGLGVFDPGINGLSVLTEVFADKIYVQSSKLTFPENKAAPIASQMLMMSQKGVPIQAHFDWRADGEEDWSISFRTDQGEVRVVEGGEKLLIDGELEEVNQQSEYQSIYQRFGSLIQTCEIEVDLAPLKLVADAFMLGERRTVEAFNDGS